MSSPQQTTMNPAYVRLKALADDVVASGRGLGQPRQHTFLSLLQVELSFEQVGRLLDYMHDAVINDRSTMARDKLASLCEKIRNLSNLSRPVRWSDVEFSINGHKDATPLLEEIITSCWLLRGQSPTFEGDVSRFFVAYVWYARLGKSLSLEEMKELSAATADFLELPKNTKAESIIDFCCMVWNYHTTDPKRRQALIDILRMFGFSNDST